MHNDSITDTTKAEKPFHTQLRTSFADIIDKPNWVISNSSKKPTNPHDGGDKWKDQTQRGTLDQVCTSTHFTTGCIPALVLTPDLNLVCIDLDDCLSEQGSLSPLAQELHDKLNSLTFVSRSGKGLHIYIKGDLPQEYPKRTSQTPGIEIYLKDKVMGVTGALYGQALPIREATADLQAILDTKPGFRKEKTPPTVQQQSPVMEDVKILELLNKATNKEDFRLLFEEGNTTKYGNDASAADMALFSHLAFYTQNIDQIERIARQSKLYRSKWDTNTAYIPRTIAKALSKKTATYQPSQNSLVKYATAETTQSSLTLSSNGWHNPLPIEEGEDLNCEFPIEELPEVFRDAVKEVSRWAYVDPALVALPGLGISALQIGKKALICEKEGLLHHPALFLCGIAESGDRKTTIYKALLDAIIQAIITESEEHKIEYKRVAKLNEVIDEAIKNIKKGAKGTASVEKATQDILELEMARKEFPTEPKNFGDDITPERLFQKLHMHKGAYGVFSSDGRHILNRILGKGSKDGNTCESIYIAGMWGDDIDRSRVGNNTGELGGEDMTIHAPALTTMCFVQPDRFKEFAANKNMRDSGLIARLSIVVAKSNMGLRFEEEKEIPLNNTLINPFQQTVLRLKLWKPNTTIVRLDQHAAASRRDFYNAIEKQQGVGGCYEDVQDIASKVVSMTARYALIFKLLSIASNGALPNTIPSITNEEWCQAQALEEYFFAQAIDSRRTHSKTGANHTLKKVATWLIKYAQENSTESILFVLISQMKKFIRGFDPEDFKTKLLPHFIEQGWLKTTETEKKVEVNPKIRQFIRT